MWICSTIGTFSVVKKDASDEFLTIRARRLVDLQRLKKLWLPTLKIESTDPSTTTDYPFRGTAGIVPTSNAIGNMVCAIDYNNFKNRAKEVQGDDVGGIYLNVWRDLIALEHPPSSQRTE